MPNVKLSPVDEKKVRAARLLLNKQRDMSQPAIMKVAVQFELQKYDDRIRRRRRQGDDCSGEIQQGQEGMV
ncbi:MAG: hypothetical protein J2P17_27720 [Mycobacterium sp.]|nr:hypothetical protein [Mycobacterium sp.]